MRMFRKQITNFTEKYHKWYAWYPVQIKYQDENKDWITEWIWLEEIDRMLYLLRDGHYIYKYKLNGWDVTV